MKNKITTTTIEPFVDDNRYKKNNILILSKYSSSLEESQIIALALSMIEKKEYSHDQYGRIVCNMKAKYLREKMHGNSGSFYSRLRLLADCMTTRNIGIFTDNEFDYINIISRAKYANGTFTIIFNPDCNDILLNLNKKYGYTTLDLDTMLKFEKNEGFRLYEFLASRSFYPMNTKEELKTNIFKIHIGLSELKLQIGTVNAELDVVKKELHKSKSPNYDRAVAVCPEQQYVDWYEFNRKILSKATKEIERVTDMKVTIKPIKGGQGAKVYALDFIVDLTSDDKCLPSTSVENSSQSLPYKNVEINDNEVEVVLQKTDDEKLECVINTRILMPDISTKDATAICEVADYDEEIIKKAFNKMRRVKNGVIENKVGWIISCIKENYCDSKYINNFTNFEQQNIYDFDELEKSILSN